MPKNMLQGKKAILFDLDGTLMDSMWAWEDIDIEYLGRFGHAPTKDMQRAIEGMSFTETAQYFKDRYGIPDSVETIKAEWNRMAYDVYAKRVKLKPGAYGFLKEIRRSGLLAGITSSNSRELIRACLTSNRVEDCFDVITISCEVAKGKPAPDIYLSAADKLRVTPDECLVFEDIPMGILAAKNAGMEVCAVEDDFSADQRERIRCLADYYIKSYDEVLSESYETLGEKID